MAPCLEPGALAKGDTKQHLGRGLSRAREGVRERERERKKKTERTLKQKEEAYVCLRPGPWHDAPARGASRFGWAAAGLGLRETETAALCKSLEIRALLQDKGLEGRPLGARSLQALGANGDVLAGAQGCGTNTRVGELALPGSVHVMEGAQHRPVGALHLILRRLRAKVDPAGGIIAAGADRRCAARQLLALQAYPRQGTMIGIAAFAADFAIRPLVRGTLAVDLVLKLKPRHHALPKSLLVHGLMLRQPPCRILTGANGQAERTVRLDRGDLNTGVGACTSQLEGIVFCALGALRGEVCVVRPGDYQAASPSGPHLPFFSELEQAHIRRQKEAHAVWALCCGPGAELTRTRTTKLTVDDIERGCLAPVEGGLFQYQVSSLPA